jgi:hypothetical protein
MTFFALTPKLYVKICNELTPTEKINLAGTSKSIRAKHFFSFAVNENPSLLDLYSQLDSTKILTLFKYEILVRPQLVARAKFLSFRIKHLSVNQKKFLSDKLKVEKEDLTRMIFHYKNGLNEALRLGKEEEVKAIAEKLSIF